jgi:hypothetical protein
LGRFSGLSGIAIPAMIKNCNMDLYSSSEPSHQYTRSGLHSCAISATQLSSFGLWLPLAEDSTSIVVLDMMFWLLYDSTLVGRDLEMRIASTLGWFQSAQSPRRNSKPSILSHLSGLFHQVELTIPSSSKCRADEYLPFVTDSLRQATEDGVSI